jgi:mono/diheme cytochrome c family protein
MSKLIPNSMTSRCVSAAMLVAAVGMGGCRGNSSEDPPVHLQRNMFTQDKGKAQRESDFFADKRAMRPIDPETVTTTAPIEPTAFYTGKDQSGQFVTRWPAGVTVDQELLNRGQERFNIYCAPCHDRTGSGNGLVMEHVKRLGAVWVPKSYYDESVLKEPVGQLFDVISHGKNTMPSYGYQVPVRDRWAIVAYVRALQRSQNLSVAQLSPEQRNNLK